jgi:HD-GYP domain-containing protein (c-di-GMP phosphodiesterase class II)
MLCSIADVYDAMRSQRAYQQAFPSDQPEVMKSNDGHRFDQNLVRRCTSCSASIHQETCPPRRRAMAVGSLHAPEPFRPV